MEPVKTEKCIDPVRAAAEPKLAAVGAVWDDVVGWANGLANLLEADGPTVVHLVRTSIRFGTAFITKDFTGILAALSDAKPDFIKIAADLRALFAPSAP